VSIYYLGLVNGEKEANKKGKIIEDETIRDRSKILKVFLVSLKS